jgi:Co/Zn/Cd efflux system component
MADACCSSKRDTIAELGRKTEQRRVLIIVMLINLAMFIVELAAALSRVPPP